MDVECKINKLKTYIALSPNGSTSSGKLQVTTIKPMIDRNQNLDENLINSIMTTEKISGKIKINNPNTNLITYSLDNSNSKITSDNENKESTFETKLEEESNLQINRSSNNFKKYDIKISFMPDNNNYDSSTAIYHLRKNLTYKVTLDANKGKIQGNDTKICYLSSNDTYKDCLEVPVRVGYVFKGWKYNNETITNNTIFKENQPIKVIASWEPIKYTISFNGYGSSITCTYNKYCTLTKANLKNGYTFLGWATSSSGGVVYSDEQSVINLTTKNEEVINLYAKWKANTYTIVFDGNGNKGGSTASKNCTYDANCTLTSNGFSKTGYTFSGWATSSSGGVIYSNGQSVKNLTSTDGGTVTLYAKWKANTYTIVFIGNGNNGGSTKNKTCTYDTDCTLTSNGFTKTGYHFSKWSFGNSTYNNKATVKNLTTTNNGTVNLTANWKANTYTIVFDGNKNTSGKTASKNCTYDTNCTLTSNGFSRTGYSFSKWSFGNSTYNNKATVKNLTTTNNGTVTLKANWVDKIKPTCETTKSNTDSNKGVTVTVKCSDSGSGCKNASSKHTGVKKDTTYTVKDNSGNSGSCSVSVSSKTKWRKKTCSTCKRCSDAGCDSYSYTPWSKSNSSSNVVGVDPKNCTTYNKTYSDFKKRVCNNGSAVVINGRHECPCYIYTRSKYCNTYKRSCSSCGCSSWGSWGSYSTTKCSKDSSTKCESAKFYS
jgi:uncharacterized repeat protein (TIGR02543 family)